MESDRTRLGADVADADATVAFGERATALAQSKEEVVTDLRNLVRECRAFLKSTAGLSNEAVMDAREKFSAKLADVEERWILLSQTARAKSRQAAIATDDYVRTKPWLAMSLAAGLAFLIASLATRR